MRRVASFLPYIFCGAAAAIVLAICSRSSALYVFNFWDDANCYFTIGKSMLQGRVPYRDLFDQKGILLYFIYGLGYGISHRTFAGVFLMELAAGFAVTCGIYRILLLYSGKSPALAAFFVPVVFALICSSRSFYWGGSAEEFVLPFLVWGLYLMLHHYKAGASQAMSGREIFIGGVLAGCVFNIKFTSLGFFIAWIVIAAAMELRASKGRGAGWIFEALKGIVKDGILYLAGMAAVTLPFLIYFLINNAVMDWLRVYIYLNVFVYAERLPLFSRIYRMLRLIYDHIWTDKGIALPIIAAFIYGVFRVARDKKPEVLRRVSAVVFLLASLLFFIFIGGVDLPYYPYPAAAFTVLGFAAICDILSRFSDRGVIRGSLKRAGVCLLLGLTLFCGAFYSYKGSMNVADMGITEEGLWLYEFRDRIAESGVEAPSLINIYSFDNGLYTVTGIVPDCYYPQTQTIHLDDVWLTQKKYIADERADFIISRDVDMDFSRDKYELIDQRDFTVGGIGHTYYLYEKISDISPLIQSDRSAISSGQKASL